MTGQRLLSDAIMFVTQVKEEEEYKRLKTLQKKKEISKIYNTYASFAHQVIVLINNGQAANKEEILKYTRKSYSRHKLEWRWHNFGRLLNKTLRPQMGKDELLYFFGYLQRLLAIEGKRENRRNENSENRRHKSPREQWSYRGHGKY